MVEEEEPCNIEVHMRVDSWASSLVVVLVALGYSILVDMLGSMILGMEEDTVVGPWLALGALPLEVGVGVAYSTEVRMMADSLASLVVVEVASLVVALVRALLVLHSIQVVPYTVLGMCMLELGVQQADEGLHTNGDRWVGNWKQEGLAFLVLQGGQVVLLVPCIQGNQVVPMVLLVP